LIPFVVVNTYFTAELLREAMGGNKRKQFMLSTLFQSIIGSWLEKVGCSGSREIFQVREFSGEWVAVNTHGS
jgi:LytS/YehU family sensor histidine kinase